MLWVRYLCCRENLCTQTLRAILDPIIADSMFGIFLSGDAPDWVLPQMHSVYRPFSLSYCYSRSPVHFLFIILWFCIRRRHYPQLSYFNGPWISRIILILVSIWWGFGEIFRLSFLKPIILLISWFIWQLYNHEALV